jgi:hypothetical protein
MNTFLENVSPQWKEIAIGISIAALVYLVLLFVFPDYYNKGLNASKKSDSTSYKNAIQNLEAYILTASNEEETQVLIQLARLYHSGIPEKNVYNNQGDLVKIDGALPDISKAIQKYSKAYNEKKSQLAGLELANLYHYESESGFMDLKKAEDIYRAILDYGARIDASEYYFDDAFVMSEARNQLVRLQSDQSNLDLAENVLGPGGGVIEYQAVGGIGGGARDGVFLPIPPLRVVPPRAGAFQLQMGGGEGGGGGGAGAQPLLGTGQYRNDPQNSHDHSVVQTVRQSIQNLIRHTDIDIDIPTCFFQIRERCRGNEKAQKVLDTIEKSTLIQNHAGMKESELLQLVWNRIHMLDPDQRETLVSNLINELSESVEHGLVMCGTGRTNRIVDTLNIVDPLVTIKPKWALTQEMTTKAGKIREEMVNKMTAEDKQALEAPEPTLEQENVCTAFNNKLKETLLAQFKRDYVDRGLMEETILENEIEKWGIC